MDYRLKENRLEGFYKYFQFIMENEEYDPAYYTMNYLINRYELNKEQILWFCFLYGFTYNACTAWVMINEFPDFENVDLERLTKWENENWRKLDYETDTKYKKGKLQKSFPDYQRRVSEFSSQEEFFKSICNSEDPKENFRKLWDVVNDFYLFGRYSTYFYLETLLLVGNLPIEFDSLMLRDISGSKSHRNGLCIVLGKDEWVLDKKRNPQFKAYTEEQLIFLEKGGDSILEEMHRRFPKDKHLYTYNTLETALCADKGCRLTGRRWAGFYLDRDAHQLMKMSSYDWYGIDWNVFWQCRKENIDPSLLVESSEYKLGDMSDKEKKDYFMKTGQYLNITV